MKDSELLEEEFDNKFEALNEAALSNNIEQALTLLRQFTTHELRKLFTEHSEFIFEAYDDISMRAGVGYSSPWRVIEHYAIRNNQYPLIEELFKKAKDINYNFQEAEKAYLSSLRHFTKQNDVNRIDWYLKLGSKYNVFNLQEAINHAFIDCFISNYKHYSAQTLLQLAEKYSCERSLDYSTALTSAYQWYNIDLKAVKWLYELITKYQDPNSIKYSNIFFNDSFNYHKLDKIEFLVGLIKKHEDPKLIEWNTVFVNACKFTNSLNVVKYIYKLLERYGNPQLMDWHSVSEKIFNHDLEQSKFLYQLTIKHFDPKLIDWNKVLIDQCREYENLYKFEFVLKLIKKHADPKRLDFSTAFTTVSPTEDPDVEVPLKSNLLWKTAKQFGINRKLLFNFEDLSSAVRIAIENGNIKVAVWWLDRAKEEVRWPVLDKVENYYSLFREDEYDSIQLLLVYGGDKLLDKMINIEGFTNKDENYLGKKAHNKFKNFIAEYRARGEVWHRCERQRDNVVSGEDFEEIEALQARSVTKYFRHAVKVAKRIVAEPPRGERNFVKSLAYVGKCLEQNLEFRHAKEANEIKLYVALCLNTGRLESTPSYARALLSKIPQFGQDVSKHILSFLPLDIAASDITQSTLKIDSSPARPSRFKLESRAIAYKKNGRAWLEESWSQQDEMQDELSFSKKRKAEEESLSSSEPQFVPKVAKNAGKHQNRKWTTSILQEESEAPRSARNSHASALKSKKASLSSHNRS
jgi:hypothetical protein